MDGVGVLNGHKYKVNQTAGDNEESVHKLTDEGRQKVTLLEEEGLISLNL